jgi:mono/diheme cytochrome c family protein
MFSGEGPKNEHSGRFRGLRLAVRASYHYPLDVRGRQGGELRRVCRESRLWRILFDHLCVGQGALLYLADFVGTIPMRPIVPIIRVSCSLVVAALVVSVAIAAVTPEQKKELKDIGSDITKASSLVSKKKYDEAEPELKGLEQRLEALIKEGKVPETDPAVKPIRLQLDKAKALLAKASGKGSVSFARDVAPIFVDKCVGCHTDGDAKGGLRLDTYAAMEKGGGRGPLAIPGNAQSSNLIQKLITPNAQQRMPKGGEALKDKEIQIITTWVNEGAKFDGADKNAELASLDKKPAAAPVRVEIAKATGNEKVSFMRDIMPEMMDTCGRCHNDRQKRSGFSVASFEKVMQGGTSGRVVIAGNPDASRLWRLVNGDDTPVMPAGNQTGITRKWYNNLKTWIEEGAKFDGDDPKKGFPTLEEREAAALAKLSPEQWNERRKKETAENWKKTFQNSEPVVKESADFLIYGDVSPERIEAIDKWATDQAASLKTAFNVKETQLWKGKLAVFVFKDRFGYEEFNQSVHRREVPREIMGHSEVSGNMEEALIAIQDIGDAATESSPGMHVNVIEHVTGAFLKRGGGGLPDWVIRGAGLALANQQSKGNPYIVKLPGQAGEILREARIDKPEDIFGNGTFAPGEVGPIGFTLVDFMLKRGGPNNFGQFVKRLQGGEKADAALRAVYNADAKTLALAYANSLPAGSSKKKK